METKSFASLFKNKDLTKVEVKNDIKLKVISLSKENIVKKKDIIKWLNTEVDTNLTHLDILYNQYNKITRYATSNQFTFNLTREKMFGEFCSWAYINSSHLKYYNL